MHPPAREAEAAVDGVLTTARLVHGAMVLGVAAATVVFFLLSSGPPGADPAPLLPPALAAFGLMQGLAYAVVPEVLAAAALNRLAATPDPPDPRAVARIWWQQRLIGWALVEAAALANAVGVFLGGGDLSLAVTLALLLFLLLLAPRRAHAVQWVRGAMENIEVIRGPRR